MALREVGSHDEMLRNLDNNKKNYILLYKKGSETSECSYKNIERAIERVKNVNVAAADVTSVRDIHPIYSVTSAPSLLIFEGKRFIKIIKGCNGEDYYTGLFEENLYTATATDGEEKSQKRVTVYSTPSCSWCNTLKTYLKKNGIHFRNIDVSKDQKAAEAMVARSGQQGVPQTDINGEIIVGFDKNRINTLLGIH